MTAALSALSSQGSRANDLRNLLNGFDWSGTHGTCALGIEAKLFAEIYFVQAHVEQQQSGDTSFLEPVNQDSWMQYFGRQFSVVNGGSDFNEGEIR